MAFNKVTNTYEITRWINPIDGINLLPENKYYLSYNKIIFEIAKTSPSIRSSYLYYQNNSYKLPISVGTKYYHTYKALNNTLKVFNKDTLLLENINYRYNSGQKYIEILAVNSLDYLYFEYIPEDISLLYDIIPISEQKSYCLKVKKESSKYIYNLIVSSRIAIEDLYSFFKLIPPLWIGGIYNTEFGKDNIIKYKTPIYYEHINQLMIEILKLVNYINMNFTGININFNTFLDINSIIKEDIILDILKSINHLEGYNNILLSMDMYKNKLNI